MRNTRLHWLRIRTVSLILMLPLLILPLLGQADELSMNADEYINKQTSLNVCGTLLAKAGQWIWSNTDHFTTRKLARVGFLQDRRIPPTINRINEPSHFTVEIGPRIQPLLIDLAHDLELLVLKTGELRIQSVSWLMTQTLTVDLKPGEWSDLKANIDPLNSSAYFEARRVVQHALAAFQIQRRDLVYTLLKAQQNQLKIESLEKAMVQNSPVIRVQYQESEAAKFQIPSEVVLDFERTHLDIYSPGLEKGFRTTYTILNNGWPQSGKIRALFSQGVPDQVSLQFFGDLSVGIEMFSLAHLKTDFNWEQQRRRMSAESSSFE